jgi:hypothetical protein
MTINTFQTYDAIGNREDLSDVISIVAREETVFYDMCGKTKATATYHEWQTDDLAEPQVNAAIDGADATPDALTATTRLGNYTQIFTKTVSVSGTQETVNKAGRASEMAYQMDKKLREIARDMEIALVGNQAPSAGSGVSARFLRPLEGWYSTNTSRGTGGAAGTATAAATDGTQRTFTNTLLDTVLQSIYESGGGANRGLTLMVAPKQKKVVTTFGNTSSTAGYEKTRFRDEATRIVTQTVDIYESDFGDVKVVMNPLMKNTNAALNRERTAHILDPDYWAVAVLRPIKQTVLAKVGDSEQRQILTECTLEAKNEKSSGVVADLS